MKWINHKILLLELDCTFIYRADACEWVLGGAWQDSTTHPCEADVM